MSQVDQTSFQTVEFADAIKEKLTLDTQRRVIEGDTFLLELLIPIAYEDSVEDGKFSLIVERVTGEPAFTHANGDLIYQTWARVEPEGEAFQITVAVPEEGQELLKAVAYVANEMEQIVHEYLTRQDRIG